MLHNSKNIISNNVFTGHFLFRMVINKEVLLSPLPSNFASENAITALQETELDTSALGLCG
jgi:hypothetical protein